MKKTFKLALVVVLVALVCNCLMFATAASAQTITTTPTGYTKASDVVYLKEGKYIANWGARGEVATFLTTYAQEFYTGINTYEVWRDTVGGTTNQDTPSSPLYLLLKSFMTDKHTYQTSYGEIRYQLKYTDCVANDTTKLSTFYTGTIISSTWDYGASYEREHIWPASKSIAGRLGNDGVADSTDIMTLRPALPSANGNRSNTAYGVSQGYYDPGESNRGDCARMTLYVYVRYGLTWRMFGTAGVIESIDVLLDWMEQDPVDTWELARNDAVQAITGTRNVFVDYPQLAWHLFSQDLPEGMQTPSGITDGQTEPEQEQFPWLVVGIVGGVVIVGGTIVVVAIVIKRKKVTIPANEPSNID